VSKKEPNTSSRRVAFDKLGQASGDHAVGFPPTWSVEDVGAAFVVKDSAGQKLAYAYFRG